MRFFTVLLLVAALALGQSYYGTVVGNVTDSSGAVVAGATITLTNSGTNERKTIQSGNAMVRISSST